MLVKGTITVPNTTVVTAATNNDKEKVIFKNCAPFTDCISELDNTQVDYAKDVVMLIYNLIEYSNNYSKTSRILWQYCRDESAVNNSGAVVNFFENDITILFKNKEKITGQTNDKISK